MTKAVLGGRPLGFKMEPKPEYFEALELVKKFIRDFWEKKHYSPSVAEISDEFGVSTSVTNGRLHRLERTGWLEPREYNVSRNIVPVDIFKDRPVFPDYIFGIDLTNGTDQGGEVMVEKMTDGRFAIVRAKADSSDQSMGPSPLEKVLPIIKEKP